MFQVQPRNGSDWRTSQCDRGVASGMHSGGINVALADGSTRFVRQSIEPRLWWFALTVDGGDILNGDW